MQGIHTYAAENQDFIPGLNTSARKITMASTEGTAAATGLSVKATQPTQSWDWMTPSVDPSDLSQDRVGRILSHFQRYADPAMTTRCQPIAPTAEVTLALNNQGGSVIGPSYIMPAAFQTVGFAEGTTPLPPTGPSLPWPYLNQPEARPPSSYFPRLDRVGLAAKKVGISDGFVHLSPDGSNGEGRGIFLNAFTDPGSTNATRYGAFVDPGPIARDSNVFRTPGEAPNPASPMIPTLTYRHTLTINVAFFDGHGSELKFDESHDPTYWYPSKTELFKSQANFQTDVERYYPDTSGGGNPLIN